MQNIYFETYGCALNRSDSETMKGILEKNGFNIVSDIEKSDVIIINSCTVKLSTFNKFKFLLKKYSHLKNKKLIIAGCVSQTNLDMLKKANVSAIGVDHISDIVEVVKETLSGKIIHLVGREKNVTRLNLSKNRENPVIEIVPISQGCLGNCSYCKVKLARGDLKSYSVAKIVKQVKDAAADGVKEIWLTSQDNGCYGLDINTNIIELLEKLVTIKGNFKIRVGMANPNFVYKYLDGFLKIFDDPKMFRFIHIPLQAGSNKVLRDMRRKYTKEEFIEVVTKLRSRYPDISISTDIICGFPTETEADFKETLDVVKKLSFDTINISKYSSMDQTDASKMKQLTSEIIKDRSKRMTDLYHKTAKNRNQFWMSWEGLILIDEYGKDDTAIGRNECYRPVIVDNSENEIELGDYIFTRVNKVTSFDLRN